MARATTGPTSTASVACRPLTEDGPISAHRRRRIPASRVMVRVCVGGGGGGAGSRKEVASQALQTPFRDGVTGPDPRPHRPKAQESPPFEGLKRMPAVRQAVHCGRGGGEGGRPSVGARPCRMDGSPDIWIEAEHIARPARQGPPPGAARAYWTPTTAIGGCRLCHSRLFGGHRRLPRHRRGRTGSCIAEKPVRARRGVR